EHERKLASGEFRKVGVNCHQIDEAEREVEFHPYDEKDAVRQTEALNILRTERNQAQVGNLLAGLKSDAQAGRNVMPAIMAAVQAYATVGEITNTLVEVYGRYREPVRF
ncbi:MAG: methylmalonyl-CoA mutase family protein, partial [Sphingomonadales bacterium]